MVSPKEHLEHLAGAELDQAIGKMLNDQRTRERYLIFFSNEYYPALIPIHDKMVLLLKAVQGLIERGAWTEKDREIINCTQRLAPELFVNQDS